MKTPLPEDVLRPLRAVSQRLAARQFLIALVQAALLAGAILVGFAAVNRWLLDRMPVDLRSILWVLGGACVFALILAIVRRRSIAEIAAVIDRLGGTRDRFVTALDFSADTKTGSMRDLARQECARFIQGGDFGSLIRVRVPREAVYLLVPVTALVLLHWEARATFAARRADETTAQAAVEDTARKLGDLARWTAEADINAKAGELRQLAEQLKRSAEQLRANARNPEDASKAALRELSALEQLVQEMQKSPDTLSPKELKALADALKENEATEEAASALAEGDPARAAEELEKAMQQLAEQNDQRTPGQIKEALERAMKRLAEQKQLSEAMRKLAQQMQRAMQQGGNSSEAAQKLAQMLRQMAQGKSGQQSPGQQNAQALQNLLSALQNMKFGEGQNQPGDRPKSGPQPGTVMIQSFAKGDPNALSGEGDPHLPSGQPGSERDTGTTDSPLGKDRNPAGGDAQAQQLAGRQGEGESLQQSLLSAGDLSKSKRGYKQLYDAMAPAAQEAVLQEDIPLGSRFFIKRYFESIRPQE